MKALCLRRRRNPASAVRVLVIVHLRGNRLMAFSLALLALRSGVQVVVRGRDRTL
jgi:hypothetical protein